MEGRLRERWGLPSGELRWGVLRNGFAIGAIVAAACWLFVHAGEGAGEIGDGNDRIGVEKVQTAAVESVEVTDAGQELAPMQIQPPVAVEPIAAATQPPATSNPEPNISVYLQDKRMVENIPLETYVLGVVAAEMPLDFEPAALEAQALAARTYIVRRLLADNRDGVPGRLALVTDQVTHQAYLSQTEIARLQESNPQGLRKAEAAVERSRDRIISYDGDPIEALFFSASNGYTENSEEVFPNKVPYLRSVPSPWDEESRHSSAETVKMPLKEFYRKLDMDEIPVISRGKTSIRVLEWTQGRRVKLLRVGSKSVTGEEARSKLGLRSASFDVRVADGEVAITTRGNGHGVGMSQWGAEGMAKAGRSAEEIVMHYYTGARIAIASKLLTSAEDGV